MDPFGWAAPARDVAETRERLGTALAANGGWTWAIRLRPSHEALGTIGTHSDQGSSIRGLSWHLRRSHWGRGIMTEAAPVVIDHLLAQPGITGVEAWIDTRNRRSIGVARRAGLSEVARMARVYDDHIAQQVVMARAAEPRDDDVMQVRPYLAVLDVRVTASLMSEILGLHVAFLYPDPPTFARLTVAPWSGSGGIDLAQAMGEITPATVRVDLGIAADLVHARACASGVEVDGPPADQPWYRRTFTFSLPEGHRIQVDGPLRPKANATALQEESEHSGG
jgi:RimJ/RimL family protein N-acetyltransferase